MVAWPPVVVIEEGDVQDLRLAIVSLVVPIKREDDIMLGVSFDVALPHDGENPVVVAEFRTRLEADEWPENICVVGESPWVFVLEAENLVDRLFWRDSSRENRPEDMLSVGALARVYLIII